LCLITAVGLPLPVRLNEKMNSACKVCGVPAELQCTVCKKVSYCCRDHQKRDRKKHKRVCKRLEMIATVVPEKITRSKVCSLLKLPMEVLYIIGYYLVSPNCPEQKVFILSLDLTHLLNANKSPFRDWKRQIQILKLNQSTSGEYLASSSFRNRARQAVVNPRQQICLDFVQPESYQRSNLRSKQKEPQQLDLSAICGVWKISILGCFVPAFSSLTEVDEVKVENCPLVSDLSFCSSPSIKSLFFNTRITDPIDVGCLSNLESFHCEAQQIMNYQSLTNLKKLQIENCSNLVDVSCFQNIPSLFFYACHDITNVTCLGNVSNLTFRSCAGIVDVSGLGGVPCLDLSGCLNIRDVSALGNVYELTLSDCSKVEDVSYLTHVVKLNLTNLRDITDISGLKSVKELNLTGCRKITDITMLHQVTVLDISYCMLIKDLSGLTELRDLTMKGNESFTLHSGLETFGQLIKAVLGKLDRPESILPLLNRRTMKRLELYYWDLPSKGLEQITSLELYHLNLIAFPTLSSSFTHLQSLEISCCPDFVALPTCLPSLGSLKISFCGGLKVLRLQGRETDKYPMYEVEIYDCDSLTEIQVMNRRVASMVVYSCESLEEITNPKLIGYLNIDGRIMCK
jgi:Leucine-rich repeat (LRR) protein